MQQFVLNNRAPFILKLCLPNRRQDAEAENNSRLNLVLKDKLYIMAYGSTPYVGMTPKKNGGHIKSAQMTRSKCLR